jgi:hypothetical protein
VERAPLVPTKVTVSIAVPSAYFERVLGERTAAAARSDQQSALTTLAMIERDEIAHIKAHIAHLLPAPRDIDPATLVTVTPFSPPPVAEKPLAAPQNRWLVDWISVNQPMLGLLALVATAVLVLRMAGFSFRARSAEAKAGQRAAARSSVAHRVVDAAAAEGPPAPKRPFGHAPAEREELAAMVRDDPRRASSVLQSWMGSAPRDR